MPRALLVAVCGLLLCVADSAPAQSLYHLTTRNQDLIYYSKLSEYLVPHTAQCFENAYMLHGKLFDYHADDRISVLMQDFGDYGNGAAGVGPRNLVSIGMAPVSNVYETLPANERMNWVMNHELVHIVTLDKPSSTDRLWRSLFFGKPTPTADNGLSMVYAYLTTPRTYSTRWYREGIAAFVETWMAGGLGRALGSYDEMMFRTMVRDSARIYDWVGLEAEGTKVDFQVGANAYLYGTRFMTYLAYTYGPEKLLAWSTRTDDSRAHFASQFAQVYGRSLTDGWNDWIGFERSWQHMNLDSIRLYPVTKVRPITDRAVGSVSRSFYLPERRSILSAVNYPGKVSHLALINIDNGSMSQVCEIKGGALYDVSSVAYDRSAQTAFFTIDNNSWRDLSSVNLATGDVTVLQRDIRVGELVFNAADRTLWGVRHDNGYCTIVRMVAPYTSWQTVYTWEYGTYVTDVDIAPDGSKLTCAMVATSGRQRLIMLSTERLLAKSAVIDTLYDFDLSVPANFVFTPDGSSLIGTSYYSGVSNVFRYTFATKDMEALSNVETGLFRPMVYGADSLFVFRYSGKGFVPSVMAIQPTKDVSAIRFLGNETIERHPVLKTWMVGNPSAINLDSFGMVKETYSPAANIRVGSIYPVVEGYKDLAAYGLRFNLADPIMLHNIDATASYTPNTFLPANERFHAVVRYKVWDWQFRATMHGADFYDLFGPTKTSRKGYSLSGKYRLPLLLNDPEIMEATFSAAGYGGLERLPDFQNIAAGYDKFATVRGILSYHWLRKSLGAPDYEKGLAWNIVARSTFVQSSAYPLVYGTFDAGTPLPIDHSAIWLRLAGGGSLADRTSSFGNFYFGGFGNNWIDHQEPKRYREEYAFPGIGLNAAGGGVFGRAMLEWLLPPMRFRNAGVWFLYASWAHPTIFTSVLTTDPDKSLLRRTYANAGAQLDVKLSVVSALDFTLSFGGAVAVERNGKPTREFMVSLKIL